MSNETKITNLRVSEIKNSENYRGSLGDLSDLMSSIKVNGLLQPVGVEKIKGGYKIVFGNRRLNAYRKLKLKTIPTIVVPDSLNKTALNLIENVHRQDVSMYEVGRAINKMITMDKMTINEVGVRLSLNKTFIRNAMASFATTPPAFRSKVVHMTKGNSNRHGNISSSVSCKINATASRYNLTKKQINTFYTHASKISLSNQQINVICHLLENGYSFNDAIKTQNKVKSFRSGVLMSKKLEQDMVTKYGKNWVQLAVDKFTKSKLKI